MNAVHEKLRKLLALARQGVGGERRNAQSLLEALMEKHGVTLDTLEGERQKLCWLRPSRTPFGKKLFGQTLFAVVGKRTTWKSARFSGSVGVDMTPAERVEFELRYAAYVPALKKELSVCYSAFVQINNIFHKDAAPAEAGEIDQEEIERLVMAMRGMKVVPVRPAITGGAI